MKKKLKQYLAAVQSEMSYVGGDGCVEYWLWEEIKELQKDLKKLGIEFPEYESIECSQEDWV